MFSFIVLFQDIQHQQLSAYPLVSETTLLYHLEGEKLLKQKNELDVDILVPEVRMARADIGSGSSIEATTFFPNVVNK